MLNVEMIPLCIGSDISVYDPSIEFFMDMIDRRRDFSFVREAHGVWDGINLTIDSNPDLKRIKKFHIGNIDYLSMLLYRYRRNQFHTQVRHWHAEDFIWTDNLRMIVSEKPENFFFAISDVAFYFHDKPTHKVRGLCALRQEAMKKVLPEKSIFYNAAVWRKYALNGDLDRFFEKYKDHRIVLVGAGYFKDLGERLGLTNYHLFQIHEIEGCKYAEQYLKELKKLHISFKGIPVLYLFVAGELATWLIIKLHNELPNSFLIDIGRALDKYYLNYNDPEWTKRCEWLKNSAWTRELQGRQERNKLQPQQQPQEQSQIVSELVIPKFKKRLRKRYLKQGKRNKNGTLFKI